MLHEYALFVLSLFTIKSLSAPSVFLVSFFANGICFGDNCLKFQHILTFFQIV